MVHKKTVYIYSSVIGIHLLDQEFKLIKKLELDEHEQGLVRKGAWTNVEKSVLEQLEADKSIERIIFVGYKYDKSNEDQGIRRNIKKLVFSTEPKVLEYFKSQAYFEKYRIANIKITKHQIQEAISSDDLMMQAVNSIDEATMLANTLSRRLREWYSFTAPEYAKHQEDNKALAEIILKKSRKEILELLSIPEKSSMGKDLSKEDLAAIRLLATQVCQLYEYRDSQIKGLDSAMQKNCPNLKIVAGTLLGARLLSLAGGLQKMAEMPSSTIQLLGAEKALFRHIRTGAKCPKYGIIHEHQLIAKSKREHHGKIARALADKISIAVKVDYFKGELIGDKLVADLEKRFLLKTEH